MPKIKSGLIKFSGKMGDEVFVESNVYDHHVRKAPKPGSKKNETALKQNYKRTALLNKLASAINRIINRSDDHKHPGFYFEIQKRFRKQPLNNRFLLLTALKGMDIHPRYTIDKLAGSQDVLIKPGKKTINVHLWVTHHPKEFINTNCYCYEILLISWNKSANEPTHQRQFSEWIYLKKDKPEFEFSFSKGTSTIHWLLCLKQQTGLNGEPGSRKLQGMRIIEVGTFNKKEEAMLKKNEEQKKKLSHLKKQEVEVVRVKAKHGLH